MSQNNLGLKYANGKGVTQDYKLAVKLFSYSAKQGHMDAQTSLGYMYENGHGVDQSMVFAYMWYNLAAAQGQKTAKNNTMIVVKKMSVAEIEEAQTLAKKCISNNYEGCQ